MSEDEKQNNCDGCEKIMFNGQDLCASPQWRNENRTPKRSTRYRRELRQASPNAHDLVRIRRAGPRTGPEHEPDAIKRCAGGQYHRPWREKSETKCAGNEVSPAVLGFSGGTFDEDGRPEHLERAETSEPEEKSANRDGSATGEGCQPG